MNIFIINICKFQHKTIFPKGGDPTASAKTIKVIIKKRVCNSMYNLTKYMSLDKIKYLVFNCSTILERK
jgi:hypothetical protein